MKSKKEKPLFRVLLHSKSAAEKVLFFVTSYKVPWYVYKLPIEKLRRVGYEVVVYDLNDYILDNDDPEVLIKAVQEINADINNRVTGYKQHGITVFDAFGNSLGSFIVYNYAVRYPLRKIVLNTGGYMSRIIFDTTDRRLRKTRKNYEARGLDLKSLEEYWQAIDSPDLGKNLKSQETFFLTSLKDKHITNEAASHLIDHMALSETKLKVSKNSRLKHSASVFKNAHSKQIFDFFVN